jgi:2-C-methyl-D-erythritol 4-phosphate cytidylyltransferase/2-C-methyl-D-erythritol 2,4-cyclodiphosphate synthase
MPAIAKLNPLVGVEKNAKELFSRLTQPLNTGRYSGLGTFAAMNDSARFALVIVAAGRGERAGAPEDGPKQYRLIGGSAGDRLDIVAVLAHPGCADIVVVIHPDDQDLFANATRGLDGIERVCTVTGGANRQASVRAGLAALAESAPRHVLIHDAVRPFVTDTVIAGVVAALEKGDQAALPAVAVADTLKRSDSSGAVIDTVPSAPVCTAPKPRRDSTMRPFCCAHERAAAEDKTEFTDDCAIAEWAGIGVRITPGSPLNIKLTTAEDIAMADKRLSTELPSRSGAIPARCANRQRL